MREYRWSSLDDICQYLIIKFQFVIVTKYVGISFLHVGEQPLHLLFVVVLAPALYACLRSQ